MNDAEMKQQLIQYVSNALEQTLESGWGAFTTTNPLTRIVISRHKRGWQVNITLLNESERIALGLVADREDNA